MSDFNAAIMEWALIRVLWIFLCVIHKIGAGKGWGCRGGRSIDNLLTSASIYVIESHDILISKQCLEHNQVQLCDKIHLSIGSILMVHL